MELVLNLDKIQSKSVSQYAKDILDNQNPYKNEVGQPADGDYVGN